MVWLSFWSIAATTPALAEEHASRYSSWRELLATLIGKGQEEGAFDTALDPALQADLLVALLDGLSVEALVEPVRISPERAVAIVDSHLQTLRA